MFLLTFSKEYAINHVIPYRKKYFFTRKGKNHIESISRQNCIFGGFSQGRFPSILSSQNALALHVLLHLEQGG